MGKSLIVKLVLVSGLVAILAATCNRQPRSEGGNIVVQSETLDQVEAEIIQAGNEALDGIQAKPDELREARQAHLLGTGAADLEAMLEAQMEALLIARANYILAEWERINGETQVGMVSYLTREKCYPIAERAQAHALDASIQQYNGSSENVAAPRDFLFDALACHRAIAAANQGQARIAGAPPTVEIWSQVSTYLAQLNAALAMPVEPIAPLPEAGEVASDRF